MDFINRCNRFRKTVQLVYVPLLLNPTYHFWKGIFTLTVPALNVRTEQTPGNLNTKKYMLARGLSQVARRLVANWTIGLDGYFLCISMSSPLPLSSLIYVDGGKMNLSFHLPVVGHAVAQLVEALRYKPEGRGFDSRWCH